LWHIINKEKINNIDFYTAICEELLGGRKLNLLEVSILARQLETEYKETLSSFYDVIDKGFYSEILDAIKDTIHRLYDNTRSTITIVDHLKHLYNGRLKNRIINHGKSQME
jgi:hypothetical protein